MKNEVAWAFSSILTFLMLTLVLLPMSSFVGADSTPPVVEWNKMFTYGTFGDLVSMTVTSDGGYALGGSVVELGAPGQTTADSWLLKLDSSGNKIWEQGLSDAYLNLGQVTSINQAIDGGYVFTCADLVKTDALGNVKWKHAYSEVTLSSVVKTTDNEYAIAGTIRNSSGADFWLAKINSNGDTQWTQTYGGPNDDFCRSLVQTFDGGYALAGSTNSVDANNADIWLVKTDSSGSVIWNQTIGTPKDDSANSVLQTSDDGYLLVGFGNHNRDNPVQNYALWLVKVDSSGKMVWNQTYNQFGDNLHTSVIATKDGGFAIADNFGLVKTDSSGRLQWSLPYDGTFAVIQKGYDYVFVGSVLVPSPKGGWIASTAVLPIRASQTPFTTQPANVTTNPSRPTALPSQPSSNPSSAFDFVKSNYLLIIVAIGVISIVVVLIVKRRTGNKKIGRNKTEATTSNYSQTLFRRKQ